MALTFTEVAGAESVSGKIREKFYDVTFDSSYPTGGEAISAADVGLLQIYGAIPVGVGGNLSAAGYHFAWDTVNNKMLAYRAGAATGTISKPTFTVTKGAILASSELGLSADAATGTVNNNAIASTLTLTTNSPVSAPTFTGSAAALAEVANATNLSAVVVRVRFKGI